MHNEDVLNVEFLFLERNNLQPYNLSKYMMILMSYQVASKVVRLYVYNKSNAIFAHASASANAW